MERLAIASITVAWLYCASCVAGDMYGALSKKNLKTYVVELDKFKGNLDTADSTGRVPIIESVKTRKAEFVLLTLEYGASALATEPGTKKTALHFAYANKDLPIARLLLSWGANPEAKDANGVPVRDLAAADRKLAELQDLFDREGAIAFEDAPGTWIKSYDASADRLYWHNRKQKKSVWRMPPSCAWYQEDKAGNTVWTNELTLQTVHKRPDALSWRQVSKNGATYWFNYRTKATVEDDPAEIPSTLLAALRLESKQFWYNEVTGDSSFEVPVSDWHPVEGPEGKVFYHNSVTKESVWEAPEDLAWDQVRSKEHDSLYWFNSNTGASQWDTPPSKAWKLHAAAVDHSDL